MDMQTLKRARILICDDQEPNVALLSRMLEAAGYENVVSTTDSSRLAALCGESPPDLILLDLHMPPPDGFEVMRTLGPLLDGPWPPFLVLTADATPEAKIRALSAGARDFLTKPLDRAEVMLRIENLLEARFLHLELRDRNERLEGTVARRETQLAESQQLGRTGSWEWDAGTNEVSWSEQYYRICGLDPQAFEPSPEAIMELIHPEDREVVTAAAQAALAEHEPFGLGFRIVRPDGEVRLLRLTGQPTLDTAGKSVKFVGTVQDITERVRAEREKELLEARVRQSERLESVGQLAGGVAHDFNNLLAVILNYAAFAAEELEEGSAIREDVEEIRRAAERAAALTHQLLVFSRREVVKPTVLDLNELVADMEKLLRRTLGEQVELVTSFEPELSSVKADRGQLEQVLVNLAVNARDAMPEGGTLTLETSNVELDAEYGRTHDIAPGGYVRLVVSDTGSGISREVAARVFEPFFTTKPKGEGTGLGLATVYGIVKQAGGHIELYSEPGHGTSFKVYLPAVGEAPLETRSVEEELDGGSGTILLVEDEEAVRKLTSRILSKHGYSVLEAGGPEEGLRVWQERGQDVDLLVTDVVMPGMSGSALAGRMQEGQPGLKVVYVSGYTDDFVARQGVLEEGVVLVEKPFTAEALLRKVREALGARTGASGG
jgi:two-component system cell cycle sensor histidine kinase/response regulator CckA